MKYLNRVAACFLIAGIFSLSACVFAGPGGPSGHDDHGARQVEASGDHDNGRHDEGIRTATQTIRVTVVRQDIIRMERPQTRISAREVVPAPRC